MATYKLRRKKWPHCRERGNSAGRLERALCQCGVLVRQALDPEKISRGAGAGGKSSGV